jgi:hypothetical protein
MTENSRCGYFDDVPTIPGESLTFRTRAEYDAFRAGFDWGDRYGTEKGWGDGYRPGDLVDVEFDAETLTVTALEAAGDDDDGA